jgi:hypothetical protein
MRKMTMIRWAACFAVVLLLMTASAFAQPFTAAWIYDSDNGSPALTTACPPQGTTPIPDGQIVKIFWDSNSNGPDPSDPQPAICIDPPACEQGPAGTVNYNQFLMNGVAQGIGAGYFYTDASFQSATVLPDPPRYYLRIFAQDGINYLWTSRVFTLSSGPQDVVLQQSDWTCGAGGPQCVVRDEHE